jgi:hypothetical protein
MLVVAREQQAEHHVNHDDVTPELSASERGNFAEFGHKIINHETQLYQKRIIENLSDWIGSVTTINTTQTQTHTQPKLTTTLYELSFHQNKQWLQH